MAMLVFAASCKKPPDTRETYYTYDLPMEGVYKCSVLYTHQQGSKKDTAHGYGYVLGIAKGIDPWHITVSGVNNMVDQYGLEQSDQYYRYSLETADSVFSWYLYSLGNNDSIYFNYMKYSIFSSSDRLSWTFTGRKIK